MGLASIWVHNLSTYIWIYLAGKKMNTDDTILLIVVLFVVLIYLTGCHIADRTARQRRDKRAEQYRRNVGCYLL